MKIYEFEHGAFHIGEAFDHFENSPDKRPWKPLNMVAEDADLAAFRGEYRPFIQKRLEKLRELRTRTV